MIRAKHHSVISPLFQWLTRILIRSNFQSVSINGEWEDNGKSVFVIANHSSWWDGFWLMHLKLNVIKRKYHFMMLEEQLRKHWYFQYAGGFSVKKNSRSAIESLNYSVELLKSAENMVLMFPQGKIHSLHDSAFKFENGASRIIEKTSDETQVLFVANLVDYLENRKPTLFIYIKSYLAKELKKTTLQTVYESFYQEAVSIQKQKNV